jgi:hypothetical protein
MLPASAIGSTRYRNRWGMRSPRPQASKTNPRSNLRFIGWTIPSPAAQGFATTEEVRAHLEEIAKLPVWRLDLVNNSAIVFDPAQLEVTDATSGESFSFSGWGLGVTQLAASGHGPGAQEGGTNLTVRSEDPPTIGNWYKSDVE